MGKKNEKKKAKKDEIVKRREAEGFLPKYSERYCGRGKQIYLGFICAFIGDWKLFSRRRRERFIPQDGTWWHFLYSSRDLCDLAVRPCLKKEKRCFGFGLRQEGIEQELFFGGRMPLHSYYDGLLRRKNTTTKIPVFRSEKG